MGRFICFLSLLFLVNIAFGQHTKSKLSIAPAAYKPKGSSDLFAMKISYADAFNNATHKQYNGNVSSIIWRSKNSGSLRSYKYVYDHRDQLIEGVYCEGTSASNMQETNDFDVSIDYDLNGNILELIRMAPQYVQDHLIYSYNSKNLLSNIEETGNISEGFTTKAIAANYLHDSNGNMKRDNHKSMTVMYNHLNLPYSMSFDLKGDIEVLYDAKGRKLQKKIYDNQNLSTKTYEGNIEYDEDQLSAIYFENGRAVPLSNGDFAYEYYIKDHLGNIRIRFSDLNSDLQVSTTEIMQENNYYPFGMVMSDNTAQVGPSDQYQYNGKESNVEFGLNWLDFQARWYDPSIARWHSVDPASEMYRNSSPYNYVLNNPLKYSDPTGMMANPVNGNEKSNEKRHSSDGLNKAVDVLQEKLSRSEKASRVIESIDKNISEMSLRELERVYEAKSDALDDVVVKMDVLGSFGKFGSLETLTKSGVEVSSDFYRSDGTRYTDLEIVSMVKDLTFSLAVLADQIPHVKLARISLSTGLFAQHVRLSFELNKLERRILKIDPDFFDTRSSFGGAGAGTNDWNK